MSPPEGMSPEYTEGSKAEKFLKEFFIMKREFFSGNSLVCDDFSNTGMAVRKFFTF